MATNNSGARKTNYYDFEDDWTVNVPLLNETRVLDWRFSSLILNLYTKLGQAVSFTSRLSASGERAPGCHWVGSCVAPDADSTLWRREKSLAPAGNPVPNSQSSSS
jgi:hypothetical protein